MTPEEKAPFDTAKDDVISRKLDTRSHLSFFFAANSGGDFGVQTLKAALWQAATLDKHIRLFTAPNRDTRKRLGRLMDPKGQQLLRILKPAFGDAHAPKQWYATADPAGRDELSLLRHVLDRCVFLSTRAASSEDDPHHVFEAGQHAVVDGIIGLHVDDIIGRGEGVNGRGVEKLGSVALRRLCFLKDTAQRLLHRFQVRTH